MPLEPLVLPHIPAPPAGLAQRLNALAQSVQTGEPEARAGLHRACTMLETHFVSWLLREMRQTIPHEDGLLPHGPPQETADQLFDDALAKAVANAGGIGLARALEAQLTRPRAPRPADPTGTGSTASPPRTPAESR